MNPKLSYTTRAAFLVKGGTWRWVRWSHNEPNKHMAILSMQDKLGAMGCDFSNADHDETARYNFETR